MRPTWRGGLCGWGTAKKSTTKGLHLSALRLFQFKSYAEASVEWAEGINVLIGPNGSGKTNILDAVHWLGMGRSRFHRKDALSVRFGAAEAAVSGTVIIGAEHPPLQYHVGISPPKKHFRIDGRPIPSLREYLGRLPLVMITPHDHELIAGGREVRRRYFDMLFSKADRQYLADLIQYHRLLQQRNRILKDYAEGPELHPLLDVIDRSMAPVADRIRAHRASAVERLLPHLVAGHRHLTQSAETPHIRYRPSIALSEPAADAFRRHRRQDMAQRTTTTGPHRDHYEFTINEAPVEVASQGQQKTLLLALKSAEWHHLAETHATAPIFLLDDVFDKLDRWRAHRLIEWLKAAGPMQIFITDTSEARCRELLGGTAAYYRVNSSDGRSFIEAA